MKRIGLLLSCTPEYGGTFQYCINMLDAIACLPPHRYQGVIAYIDPVWASYLENYPALEVHALDLVHTVRPACDLWIFPAQESWDFQMSVPVVSTIHDLMHRYESHFAEVSENGIYEQRENQYMRICRWSQGILVDSETGRQQVHNCYAFPLEKIFVLPYIPARYIYWAREVAQFESQYELPAKYLFYPAHFWPHKNHASLLQAVADLKEELPDIHLVLSGSHKEGFEQTMAWVSALGIEDRVVFTGYVPDEHIPELYKRARALVMPTFFGPTNIPPLEAFVLGCPVAISGVYGIPEQVGDAALLFDPHSTAEIADCIRRLWNDDGLCKQLRAKGTKRAKMWGTLHFNKRVESILDCILQQKGENGT